MNFWAPWCGPCRQEAPTIATVSCAFAGIAYDTNQHDVQGFLHQYGITYPYGPDNGPAIAAAFGVGGLLVTVVIDQQGRIAHKFIGPVNEASLETASQQALA